MNSVPDTPGVPFECSQHTATLNNSLDSSYIYTLAHGNILETNDLEGTVQIITKW